jgi:hypothetical protein
MARPLGIEFPGTVYHITSRDNAKQVISLDNEDRRRLMRVLSNVVE